MFVTLEGPEGAGKSTLIRSLAGRLTAQGLSVVCTREPGEGELGVKIRELLLHGEPLTAETELFLFLADRSHHVTTFIQPALAAGKIVLCDRFADSTWVYQSYARGLDRTFVRQANRTATHGLIPNLTLLLDVPPELGLSRLKNQDRIDAEPLEFHKKVREGFLFLADEEGARWKVLDARQEPLEVEKHAFAACMNKWNSTRL